MNSPRTLKLLYLAKQPKPNWLKEESCRWYLICSVIAALITGGVFEQNDGL